MKPALIALLAAAGALAACANENPPQAAAAGSSATPAAETGAAGAPSRENCFFTRDIVGHTIADPNTLYIRTRSNAVFRVDMRGACLAGRSSDDPLIIRAPPGLQYVCRAVDMDISIGRAGMPSSVGVGAFRTPCIPSTLTRLTEAEVAALPRRARP
jgi:hypothetical protein